MKTNIKIFIAFLLTLNVVSKTSGSNDPKFLRLGFTYKNEVKCDLFTSPIYFKSANLSFGQQYEGMIFEYEFDYTPPISFFQGSATNTQLGFSLGVGYCLLKTKRVQFPIVVKFGGTKYNFKDFEVESAANYFIGIRPTARIYITNKFAIEGSLNAIHSSFGKINGEELNKRVGGSNVSFSVGFLSFI